MQELANYSWKLGDSVRIVRQLPYIANVELYTFYNTNMLTEIITLTKVAYCTDLTILKEFLIIEEAKAFYIVSQSSIKHTIYYGV